MFVNSTSKVNSWKLITLHSSGFSASLLKLLFNSRKSSVWKLFSACGWLSAPPVLQESTASPRCSAHLWCLPPCTWEVRIGRHLSSAWETFGAGSNLRRRFIFTVFICFTANDLSLTWLLIGSTKKKYFFISLTFLQLQRSPTDTGM